MAEEKRPKSKRPEYMKYVTDNVRDMVPNTMNLVACIVSQYTKPRDFHKFTDVWFANVRLML